MRLKKTSQTTDLVLALFLYIPVVWAALLIAQSLGGGLPELLSNLTAALEQPFQIQWTDKSLLSILVCTGAYLMGLCLYASGQGRTRDGEEHGSAAWGSPRQLNAQFRQKQNKILTRHVRLGLDTSSFVETSAVSGMAAMRSSSGWTGWRPGPLPRCSSAETMKTMICSATIQSANGTAAWYRPYAPASCI